MAIQTRDGTVKGTLYRYKQVPKRFASVKPRRFIGITLHMDSPSGAKTKEAATWDQMVAAWQAKLAGDSTDAEQCLAAARDRIRDHKRSDDAVHMVDLREADG